MQLPRASSHGGAPCRKPHPPCLSSAALFDIAQVRQQTRTTQPTIFSSSLSSSSHCCLPSKMIALSSKSRDRSFGTVSKAKDEHFVAALYIYGKMVAGTRCTFGKASILSLWRLLSLSDSSDDASQVKEEPMVDDLYNSGSRLTDLV